MSHEGQEKKLVHMANQIAIFFASEPDDAAIVAIETHLRKFWDPRMREKIIVLSESGPNGLSDRAYAAVRRLAAAAAAVAPAG